LVLSIWVIKFLDCLRVFIPTFYSCYNYIHAHLIHKYSASYQIKWIVFVACAGVPVESVRISIKRLLWICQLDKYLIIFGAKSEVLLTMGEREGGPCPLYIHHCLKKAILASLYKHLMIDWLTDWWIIYCFTSRSRIFHLYMETSPLPVKGCKI
jgi:hypothetical protein